MNLQEIERRLGVVFRDKELLALAFIHRSFWNENQESVKGHNERLEFLGDSVLGLILAEYLYERFPSKQEGVLSELRSRLVEASSCVKYVQELKLDEFMLLGKGERMNRGKGRESIMADLFEAIIGAIYLEWGYTKSKEFFLSHFEKFMETMIVEPTRNWKAELQDYAQKKYQEPPLYVVVEESGLAHQKHFRVAVIIHEQRVAEGEGSSKKEAQADAAKIALMKLVK